MNRGMSASGTERTSRAGLRCPLFGVDRKWPVEGQNDAIDASAT
jgi:hypothetical protein